MKAGRLVGDLPGERLALLGVPAPLVVRAPSAGTLQRLGPHTQALDLVETSRRLLAQGVTMGLFRKKAVSPDVLPGGHSPSMARGCILHAEPPPPALHLEETIALGIAALNAFPLLAELRDGSAARSPLLNFKATDEHVWLLNPDGSLYTSVVWGDVESRALDEDTGVWSLGGRFDGLFDKLRLEVMNEYRSALGQLLEAKGVPTVDVVL